MVTGQWFSPLLRKSRDGVGHVASHYEATVFFERFLSGLYGSHLPLPSAAATQTFLTSIFFGRAAAAIGAVISRIPSFNSAVSFSPSTPSGSVTVRTKRS